MPLNGPPTTITTSPNLLDDIILRRDNVTSVLPLSDCRRRSYLRHRRGRIQFALIGLLLLVQLGHPLALTLLSHCVLDFITIVQSTKGDLLALFVRGVFYFW